MNCLDALKSNDVKGTFFLIAEHAFAHTRNVVDSLRTELLLIIVIRMHSTIVINYFITDSS
jgi:hypothetical protein